MRKASVAGLTILLLGMVPMVAEAQPVATELGAMPAEDQFPTVEFAFEARITLGPARTVGETATGQRQYIPITGGTIAGPKLTGRVIPGGWDYQLRSGGGCNSLTADYFWRAEDGTVIHILNEGLMCPGAAQGERNWLRPRFEAPKGPHEWLTRERAAGAEHKGNDPAEVLADRGRDLIARHAGANDQRVLRLQGAEGGGEQRHDGGSDAVSWADDKRTSARGLYAQRPCIRTVSTASSIGEERCRERQPDQSD